MLNKVTSLKYLFIYAMILFGLLLARNPFNEKTLIPNLEPYPDSVHYLTPARSFAMGGSFKITREGRDNNPGVPPLYSIFIVPFYLINSDVRNFYIANVILSFISLIFFYLILKKISDDKWVVGFALFLFVTNYFIYWYPQWAMAENLLLPIYLAAIYILTLKVSWKNIIVAGFVSVALYATKYANAPISGVYWVLYLSKILIEKKSLFKNICIYAISTILPAIVLIMYTSTIGGPNPILTTLNTVKDYLADRSNLSVRTASVSNTWTSTAYIKNNLPQYLSALVGSSVRFLWDFTPIVPRWVGITSVIGLFFGLVASKKTRMIFLSLIVMVLAEIAFMSTFYAFDMRYLYFVIPTLLFGFALLLNEISDIFTNKKKYYIFAIFIFSIFFYYIYGNGLRIKNQIALNFRHAEVPWHYVSVLNLNNYFNSNKEPKPYVITSEVPYYIDFYSNGNYRLLPISSDQEFRKSMEMAWGNYDFSDFHELYIKLLKSGNQLYVSTYGFGNEAYLHTAFDTLSKEFKLTEVQDGCYTQCKIYKLELRHAKGT